MHAHVSPNGVIRNAEIFISASQVVPVAGQEVKALHVKAAKGLFI